MTSSQPIPPSGIAVVIPTLNEEKHIGHLLKQLSAHTPSSVLHIIVADGGSSDRTLSLVSEAAQRDPRIRVQPNKDRIQAAGINMVVKTLPSDIGIIIRMDAHAGYPNDFVQSLIASLYDAEADSVVVRLLSVGGNRVQTAIAAASNRSIGSGGSVHRSGGASGFVEHGHHAAFKRSIFDKVGGYDCSFVANEDAELDFRIRHAGGRIWFNADITIDYVPRSTLKALTKQYWRYGYGRAQNFLKHKERLKIRQVAPSAIFLTFLIGALFGWIYPAAVPIAVYFSVIFLSTLFFFAKSRRLSTLLIGVVLPVMHFSWAAGFLTKLMTGRASRAADVALRDKLN